LGSEQEVGAGAVVGRRPWIACVGCPRRAPVYLIGLGISCYLGRLPPLHERQMCEQNRKGALGRSFQTYSGIRLILADCLQHFDIQCSFHLCGPVCAYNTSQPSCRDVSICGVLQPRMRAYLYLNLPATCFVRDSLIESLWVFTENGQGFAE
jgi:hypothetical protein